MKAPAAIIRRRTNVAQLVRRPRVMAAASFKCQSSLRWSSKLQYHRRLRATLLRVASFRAPCRHRRPAQRGEPHWHGDARRRCSDRRPGNRVARRLHALEETMWNTPASVFSSGRIRHGQDSAVPRAGGTWPWERTITRPRRGDIIFCARAVSAAGHAARSARLSLDVDGFDFEAFERAARLDLRAWSPRFDQRWDRDLNTMTAMLAFARACCIRPSDAHREVLDASTMRAERVIDVLRRIRANGIINRPANRQDHCSGEPASGEGSRYPQAHSPRVARAGRATFRSAMNRPRHSATGRSRSRRRRCQSTVAIWARFINHRGESAPRCRCSTR